MKTYGLGIAVIASIGGIGLALAGYFRIGAFSNMAQIDAIIMMGIGGTILLAIGLISIKNWQASGSRYIENHRATNPTSLASKFQSISDAVPDIPSVLIKIIEQFSWGIEDGVIGPEEWALWNKKIPAIGCTHDDIHVLDEHVPSPPSVEFDKKDKILLYIPRTLRVNGQERDFCLEVLINIIKPTSLVDCGDLNNTETREFSSPSLGQWILINKNVINNSLGKTYEVQKEMVEAIKGCSIPSTTEAVALIIIFFGLTQGFLIRKTR